MGGKEGGREGGRRYIGRGSKGRGERERTLFYVL